MKRKSFLAATSILLVLATLFATAMPLMAAESEITSESPDRKFGMRNFEDGRVDLVALPSRKTVVKLGAFGGIEVSWAPDSRRVAVCEGAFDDGTQLYQATIYERTGATFKVVKLPELTLAAAEWPGKKGRKAVYGREFILATRWVDANTLVLKRECQCTIYGSSGDEKDEKDWSRVHEITIAFDKALHASIKKIEKVESTPH